MTSAGIGAPHRAHGTPHHGRGADAASGPLTARGVVRVLRACCARAAAARAAAPRFAAARAAAPRSLRGTAAHANRRAGGAAGDAAAAAADALDEQPPAGKSPAARAEEVEPRARCPRR